MFDSNYPIASGKKITEIERKIMIAQVDGLTVLNMVADEIEDMLLLDGGCGKRKSCIKCKKFSKCVKDRVANAIIER